MKQKMQFKHIKRPKRAPSSTIFARLARLSRPVPPCQQIKTTILRSWQRSRFWAWYE